VRAVCLQRHRIPMRPGDPSTERPPQERKRPIGRNTRKNQSQREKDTQPPLPGACTPSGCLSAAPAQGPNPDDAPRHEERHRKNARSAWARPSCGRRQRARRLSVCLQRRRHRIPCTTAKTRGAPRNAKRPPRSELSTARGKEGTSPSIPCALSQQPTPPGATPRIS
jgi:hypothetical protein